MSTPKLPKVGMRIIKSAVAVFLCFVIYLLRGQHGTPFYSAIAAVLCMQPYVSGSVKVALNRTIGTLVGGAAGMLILLVEQNAIPPNWPLLRYLLISVMIVVLIYITVLVKKPTASYITCVVFMSITVSHAMDVNPYLFALDRVIDTLIGIFVSLGVNAFRLPRRRNRSLLFVSDLDGTLAGADGKIAPAAEIRLNKLIEAGAQFTVSTGRTPATFLPMLEGLRLKLPVIAMNGAALYDLQAKSYLYCKTIPADAYRRVAAVFERRGLNLFVHAVIHDVLHVYYGPFTNPVEEALYHARRGLPHKHYVYSRLPEGHDPLYLLCVDTLSMIETLRAEIAAFQEEAGVYTVVRPDAGRTGYALLEIYASAATRPAAVEELKKRTGTQAVVAFGDSERDLAMLEAADLSRAVAGADEAVKEAAGKVLPTGDEALAREVDRLFHQSKNRRKNSTKQWKNNIGNIKKK